METHICNAMLGLLTNGWDVAAILPETALDALIWILTLRSTQRKLKINAQPKTIWINYTMIQASHSNMQYAAIQRIYTLINTTHVNTIWGVTILQCVIGIDIELQVSKLLLTKSWNWIPVIGHKRDMH